MREGMVNALIMGSGLAVVVGVVTAARACATKDAQAECQRFSMDTGRKTVVLGRTCRVRVKGDKSVPISAWREYRAAGVTEE
jgi:hypothetical protein